MGFFFLKPVQGKTTDPIKCSYESMNSISSADVEKSHVILIHVYHVISCKYPNKKIFYVDF